MKQHQRVILNKLAAYLGVKLREIKKNPVKDSRLQSLIEIELLRRIQSLRENGSCRGFAIIHSAMDIADKADWWQRVRTLIAAWDGNAKSLKKKYILPQSEDKNPISLDTIFEKALSYIVYDHGVSESYSNLSGLSQDEFLLPNGHFELLVKNVMFKVSHREKIYGHLEHDDLVAVLNDNKTKFNMANGICLITKLKKHACSLSYRYGKNNSKAGWFFYDPNYEDGKARFFTDVHKLVSEIHNSLGEDIAIELAQLDPKFLTSQKFFQHEEIQERKKESTTSLFPGYMKLLKEDPENIMGNNGLSILLKCNPNAFLKLCKQPDSIDPIDLPYENGSTLLIMAASYGHTDIVQILLNSGADKSIRNRSGNTAFMEAVSNGHVMTVDVLINAEQEGSEEFDTPNLEAALLLAAEKGHHQVIQLLINYGAKVDSDASSYTPLMVAVQNGHLASTKVLIDTNADLTKTGPNGCTVLTCAVRSRNLKIVKEVLNNYKTNVNVQDEDGNSALMIAADDSNATPLLRILLENKAKPSLINAHGKSALYLAAMRQDAEAVDLLLEHQALCIPMLQVKSSKESMPETAKKQYALPSFLKPISLASEEEEAAIFLQSRIKKRQNSPLTKDSKSFIVKSEEKISQEPTYIKVMRLQSSPTPTSSEILEKKIDKDDKPNKILKDHKKSAGDYYILNHLLHFDKQKCGEYIKSKYITLDDAQDIIRYSGTTQNTQLQDFIKSTLGSSLEQNEMRLEKVNPHSSPTLQLN